MLSNLDVSVENPKVAVILPVYNVEQYLKECLEEALQNPCSQVELNKIVPFGFSLQRQKMVFFCHQNSIILLC